MRAIIVGSGPAGLVMGHCLLRAGIDDFVILERRADAVDDTGAGLGFWPQTFRILDQLDMLDDFLKMSVPMRRSVHLDSQGRVFQEGNIFEMMQEHLGHAFMMFLRRDVIQVLYDRLPDREKRVLPNKKVVCVRQDASSVMVDCGDGSSYTGDILIGCDGVHSAVRRLAIEGNGRPKMAAAAAEYTCLFGHGPRLDGVPPRDMTELHADGVTFQILSTDDRSFWLFYHVKDKVTGQDQDGAEAEGPRRYSAAEAEALAARYKDHPVAWGAKVSFGDVWCTRKSGSLYELEEYVAEHWYNGRVVLVGDAAHKMTPNIALGCNNAIESAASLTNHLHMLLEDVPNPTVTQLEATFALFQKERWARAKLSVNMTGNHCRRSCYQTWLGKFLLTRVMPLLGDSFLMNYALSPWAKDAVKLDFIDEKHPKKGSVVWKYK